MRSSFLQTGRDHGLPDYLTARRNMNLEKLTTFEEINPFLFQFQTHLSSPPDVRPETGMNVSRCIASLSSCRRNVLDA